MTTNNTFSEDTTAPTLQTSSPQDDTLEVPVNSDIVLTFDEAIQAGSGNIIISNGQGDTRIIDVNDFSQVSFGGSKGDFGSSKNGFGGSKNGTINTVIINPTEDLLTDSNYFIQLDEGVITDLAGNAYAGINDETTLNFVTAPPDTTAPVLQFSSPYDDALDVPIYSGIVLTFDEAIQAGSGNIIISNGQGDTRVIDVNDFSQVGFGYSEIYIYPTEDLLTDSNYFIQLDEGVITDLAGNAFAGINDETTLNFVTAPPDTTAPVLQFSSPYDDALDVPVNSDIALYFDEAIQAGSGNIIISNGQGDTRVIDVNDFNQVSFGGSKVYINPAEDLLADSNYFVQLGEGVITDLAGNAYAGANDETTLNFVTAGPDTTAPVLQFSSPYDDASEVPVYSDITLYFDEAIQAGSGNIIISNGQGDTRVIDVNDFNQVTLGYSEIYINPTENLLPDSNYFMQLDEGVITDLAGNAFAGINDETTLNFVTAGPDTTAPVLQFSSPYDDASEVPVNSGIALYFDEAIQAGSGNITISNGQGDTRVIDVNDFNQVILSYSEIYIYPTEDLLAGSNYFIQLDEGVITDLAGNAFAGINDETTLNFVTAGPDTTAPVLQFSSPYDDASEVPVYSDITLYFDEAIQAGSGNITISNGQGDTRIIDVNDFSQVSFSYSKNGTTNTININPTEDLLTDSNYFIQLDEGVITDLAGNAFAGVNDETTLNFVTAGPDTTAPVLQFSSPYDDASEVPVNSGIALYFDEAIQAGSGNITISNGRGDTRVIDVNDFNQVFLGYSEIYIYPTEDLLAGSNYFIQLDEGVITDLAGNAFAGIKDKTTLNFATDSRNGGDGNDVLSGGAGDDVLYGGGGNDVLNGRDGNDILNGGDGADTLKAGKGDDILDGGSGSDIMEGGQGNDTYYVDNSGDVVKESGGGIDTVISSVSFILGTQQENLTLRGAAEINGTGNGLANVLIGNSVNNVLDGGAGDDILNGGLGDDTLIGGAGRDVLTGGGGNDIFDFNSLRDLGLGADNRDVITDFISGQDKIDLSTIDANRALAGDQAFDFITTAFTAAGQISYNNGIISINMDADAASEFEIELTGTVPASLSAADFVL
jgi:Ca2+-binding RTX toxin-like protein